ncbi:DNA-directed RNA polymerases i, ii, and iii 145 kDa polypeptide [Delitschia confertaspora ATCC 74209]|uniref:DNA-directed RNA polymerases I, II, and III subunit RPABC3 n=1 Tax=Delitschia confertaspora ATCC 74209 TaxID=1513339 RepID=A0A9P4MR67_9PLEO|nr:DNA-directed RNA polymerases i, ii, and iii 145 kDa polypeptide [Delitschia confertaspora ATCC 74209]
MADAQLFEETFNITSRNDQKYDRVSRIFGTSTDNTTTMSLDINHELYPLTVGENVQMVLATTLNLDGTKDEKGWREAARGESTLADMYDYVCHGKVYRFEEGDGEMIKVYCSFGGLLLFIEGPFKKLTSLRIDYVYMLLKK